MNRYGTFFAGSSFSGTGASYQHGAGVSESTRKEAAASEDVNARAHAQANGP